MTITSESIAQARHRGSAWAGWAIWAAALAVAAGAAVATAHGLYEVARAADAPPAIAGLYPLITDGLALVAYAATARLYDRGRGYAWTIVVLAAGLSGLAQAAYLAGTVHTAPGWLRAGVGAWPALAAAIVAHLLYLLTTTARDQGDSSTSTQTGLVHPGVDAASNGHRPRLDGQGGRPVQQPAHWPVGEQVGHAHARLDASNGHTYGRVAGVDGPSKPSPAPTGLDGGHPVPLSPVDAGASDPDAASKTSPHGVQPDTSTVHDPGRQQVGHLDSDDGLDASNGHPHGWTPAMDGPSSPWPTAAGLDGGRLVPGSILDTTRTEHGSPSKASPNGVHPRESGPTASSEAGRQSVNPVHSVQHSQSMAKPATAKDRALQTARTYRRENGELPTVNQLAEIADVARGTAGNALKQLRHDQSTQHTNTFETDDDT